MDDIKRTAIVIAALAVLLLISSSFVGSNIMNRAIIIGVGVDKLEDGVRLTAEIVSPGNGSGTSRNVQQNSFRQRQKRGTGYSENCGTYG